MRSMFAILSLIFLVSYQAADACCEHDHHSDHVHLEKAHDGDTDQIIQHSGHHHHHGPCDCLCHTPQPEKKSTTPKPRIEIEPQALVITQQCNSFSRKLLPPSNAPPISQNLSLPPPSAAKLCSQHCRFLL
ncbi:hypothetical protein [Rubritalea tangerina]|uniref:Uncharacterized protein n=1 Tax=Rubritalea tangerina TaxID=430798 RepID=A0ABW4ZA50_9BACT